MGKLVDEIIEGIDKLTLFYRVSNCFSNFSKVSNCFSNFSKVSNCISKLFQSISNDYDKLMFKAKFSRFIRIGPTTLSSIFEIFNLSETEISQIMDSSSISCDLPVFYGAKYETIQKSVFGSILNRWGPVYKLCENIKTPCLFGISSSIEEHPKGYIFKAVVIWASDKSNFSKTLKRVKAFDVLGANLKI